MTFSEEVNVESLDVSSNLVEELERRLVLCYTGKSRLSGSIHENVWGAFRRGVPETVNALYELREGAMQMRQALIENDINRFGELIGQSWQNQKALDASVTNGQIEELFAVARSAGARTGKACGAGGGGCLLFFTEPEKQAAVSDAVSERGARVIPFHFEFEGLQLGRQD